MTNSNPFMISTLNKLGIERNFQNLKKGIYENPARNIIVKDFSFKTRKEHRCLLSLLLFTIVLEVPARAGRQESEIKGI